MAKGCPVLKKKRKKKHAKIDLDRCAESFAAFLESDPNAFVRALNLATARIEGHHDEVNALELADLVLDMFDPKERRTPGGKVVPMPRVKMWVHEPEPRAMKTVLAKVIEPAPKKPRTITVQVRPVGSSGAPKRRKTRKK